MVVNDDNKVLSDIEIILPFQIISECQSLDRNAQAFFVAVNTITSTQLTLHKLEDDSVKLRITVLTVGYDSAKSPVAVQASDTTDIDNHGTVLELAAPVADESLTQVNKRKSMKGRPRVPSAVDTSRLNKHLTAVWGSKRKKSLKKAPVPVPATIEPIVQVVNNENNGAASSHENEDKNYDGNKHDSMASTVIILKTAAKQPEVPAIQWSYGNETGQVVQWNSGNDNMVEVEMEFVDNAAAYEPPAPVKASRDIAERLKAKKMRYTELRTSEVSKTSNGVSVSCELCGENAPGYAQLVKHVVQQHEDCTFVKNYLDDIKPLAAAQSAVSIPCTDCGRTFSGRTALSAHRRECGSARSESKLGLLRRNVKAASLTEMFTEDDDDDKLLCKVCDKKFKSVSKLQQHKRTHHVETTGNSDVLTASSGYECQLCSKEFPAQANLRQHIRRVHNAGKSKIDIKKADVKLQEKSASCKKTSSSIKTTSSANTSSAGTPAISNTGEGDLQEFACNHCKTVFGRMTLLVTHMRYCLKANSSKN